MDGDEGRQTGLTPLTFGDLGGWAGDDHAAALAAFRKGAAVLGEHPPKTRATGTDARALSAILASAAGLPREISREEARVFFETEFTPFAVEAEGFFTGYYEPEVAGSMTPTAEFAVPLLRTPDDLAEIAPGTAPNLDP